MSDQPDLYLMPVTGSRQCKPVIDSGPLLQLVETVQTSESGIWHESIKFAPSNFSNH